MATTYDPKTAAAGELVTVERDKLVIDPNVRADIRLDKSFVSSIRQYGIHQPPVGWRDDDGFVHITMGQRRTSAALEIGHDVVHVIVKPQAAAEGDRAEELRIVSQLAENEQRAGLTSGETAAAYKQLALFGLTEERIARKTNSPKQKVTTALTVAGSDVAQEAAGVYELTLDQAAIIAEFDDDAEAVEALTAQAAENPDQLVHLAQRIREDRLDQEVIDRLADEITAAGATPLRNWGEKDDQAARAEYIGHLCRADDPDRAALTVDDLPTLENVFGWIQQGYRGDADRGYTINWYVNGWKAQGLAQRYRAAAAPVDPDAEKEARRAKREAKKAMTAATVVRREWLRDTLLARGHRYDDTHRRYIAGALLGAPGHLRDSRGSDGNLALELLGRLPSAYYGSSERDPYTGSYAVSITGIAYARHLHTLDPTRVALAAAIARTESVVGDEKADDYGRDARTARYLAQLRAWGYTLSDVEEAVVTAAEARAVAIAAEDAAEASEGGE